MQLPPNEFANPPTEREVKTIISTCCQNKKFCNQVEEQINTKEGKIYSKNNK